MCYTGKKLEVSKTMDKKYWHHVWTTRIRPINVWYLLVLFLVSAIVCVFSLRGNYMHMATLRQAVYDADKNDGDVKGSLQNLQRYVTTHMNTSLTAGTSIYPPVQLKYTYQRLQTAAQAAANSQNTELYNQAQKYCEQQNSTDFSGRNRVPCIEQYVSDHGSIKAAPISDALYKFNFASPTWSPDLAGWSLLLSILLLIALLLRVAAGWILKRYTK